MTDNMLWSHIFDFSVTDGGWAIYPGNGGNWQGGTIGWQSTLISDQSLYIMLNFPSQVTVTSVTAIYSVNNSISNGADDIIRVRDGVNFTGTLICDFNDPQPSGINYTDRAVTFASNCGNARSILYSVQSNGVNSLKQLALTGIGPDPFLTDDGSDCPCNYVGADQDTASDFYPT